jgi:hypothetical protein
VRLITFEGIEHRLSEKNWKQLIRRFDAKKSQPNAYGYNFIGVNSICVNRGYKCIRCPLRDPHKRINSCTYLFREIIGNNIFPHLYMLDCGIMWEPKFDPEVRKALRRVTDVLSAAQQVPDKRGHHRNVGVSLTSSQHPQSRLKVSLS